MKKSWIIIAISLLILVGAVILSSRLTVKSNMEDMLPSDSPVLQASETFNQYFDAQEMAYIYVTFDDAMMTEDDFYEDGPRLLEAISLALEDEPYVVSTLYRIDKSAFEPFYWSFLEIEQLEKLNQALLNQDIDELSNQLEMLSDQFEDETSYEYLMNDDLTHYMMIIQPYLDNNDFEATRNDFYDGMLRVMEEVQADYQVDGIEIGLTGGAFIQDLEADAIAFNGLGSTLILTLLTILLVVILFFGQLKLPILTLYPLVLGALMASAAAYLIYGSINMFSVSFALLLLGLGIDFAVHFLTKYQALRMSDRTKEIAIKKALSSSGKSIIIGALTTAFAFFTFGFAKFKAFEQMGVISALGILILCATMLILVPSLLRIMDRLVYKKPRFELSYKWLSFMGQGAIKWSALLVVLIILLGALLFQQVKDTTINGDVSAIYPEDIPSRVNALVIEEAFDSNTNTISVYLPNEEALYEAIEILEARGDVETTRSIIEFMPEHQDEKLALVLEMAPYLGALNIDLLADQKLEAMTYSDLPEDIRHNYVGRNGVLRLDIVPSVDLYQEEACDQLIQAVYDVTGTYPVGMPIVMNEVTKLVKSDMTFISIICLVVVLCFAVIAFRSISKGIMTITPILLTIYFLLGIAPIVGIELNLFSVAALPLIIGIGIDSSIHLLHGFVEEGIERVSDVMEVTGRAITLTTITTMIGFGSLATVNHPGMTSFGLIVVLGMGLNVVFTLLMIPAGFYMLSKKKPINAVKDTGLLREKI